MKRIFTLLLLFSLVFSLSACSNSVVSNPEGIKLTLNESYISYMPYEEIPDFVFARNSNFNTISNSKYLFQQILSGNDDFLVSQAISELFEKYQGNIVFKVDKETVSAKTKMNRIDQATNKRKTVNMLVDEEQLPGQDRPLRIVYDEIAFIQLENGLQLTIEYRRFKSDNITYYAWRYTRSISLYLHYPLMLHLNDNNQKELLILPLPNYTRYSVGPQLDLNKLIDKDTYLSSSYYQFNYPQADDGKQQIIDFYTSFHASEFVGDDLVLTYLGIDFKISFGEKTFAINKY